MAGLRTVVSQMIGRGSAQMRLGSVHLVIVRSIFIDIITLAHCDIQDFALVVRSHLRKSGVAVHNDAAVTLPPTALGLSV